MPHHNLNNAIIYMVIDHCSYDFFTISYWHLISDISTLILTFDQGRQKLPLLTPKKCKNEGQKKGNSPNPCWHGLFAKNRVQIGLIWPPWPRLYFTSAYRGSPPCTLFQHPDNREIGYSNVLPRPQMSLLLYTGLLQVEAPWVKMALYCDDIYIIPGQVTSPLTLR